MLRVKLEIPRSLRDDGEKLRKALRNSAAGAGSVLGRQIKRRVSKRGDVAGQKVPSYDPGKEGTTFRGGTEGKAGKAQTYNVSPRYNPASGELGLTNAGAKTFASSKDFHDKQGTKRGTFNVSGGMWSGLSLVLGAGRAAIKFRGRSEGQTPNAPRKFRSGKKAGKRRPKVKARGKKVSNALKAWTVARFGVNLLAPKASEIEALSAAVTAAFPGTLIALGTASIEWATAAEPGDPLAKKMAHEITGFRAHAGKL